MEKKWWQVIGENSPLALTLIGGALFVIGAAGGWPKPELKVSEFGWRIASALVGATALVIGIFLMWRKETASKEENLQDLDPKRYGIRITSPVRGDAVNQRFDVEGYYQVKPPDSIVVKVLDLSPTSGRYWPKSSVVTFEDDPKIWKARSIGIGRVASGAERIIVVAIMAAGGRALCDYYQEVADQINQMRKQYNDETIRLPGVVPNPGIVECDRVTVRGA